MAPDAGGWVEWSVGRVWESSESRRLVVCVCLRVWIGSAGPALQHLHYYSPSLLTIYYSTIHYSTIHYSTIYHSTIYYASTLPARQMSQRYPSLVPHLHYHSSSPLIITTHHHHSSLITSTSFHSTITTNHFTHPSLDTTLHSTITTHHSRLLEKRVEAVRLEKHEVAHRDCAE